MTTGRTARDEITHLIYRYAELIDGGDFAGVGELFADGVIEVDETGQTYAGRDQVAEMFREWVQIYSDNLTPHTRHVTTNLIVDVNEEAGTAESRAYVTVLQCAPNLPLQPILSGRYRDNFRRVDGAWSFARRRMTNEYLGDLSQHLAMPFG